MLLSKGKEDPRLRAEYGCAALVPRCICQEDITADIVAVCAENAAPDSQRLMHLSTGTVRYITLQYIATQYNTI